VRPAGRRTRRWRPRPDADRGAVALLDGCVMDGLYAHVHAASRPHAAAPRLPDGARARASAAAAPCTRTPAT
jgi:hypothetical protein